MVLVAAHHYSPLLFTSMLAQLSPLLALHIENLERLKVNLHETVNIHSNGPLPGWPKDCSELPASSSSGVYIIQPTGQQTIVVYCEMNREDGGWTVIQRNHRDTPVSWNESQSTYKHGLGMCIPSSGWAPSTSMRQKVYHVRFVIWDASNNMKCADYNLFSLDDESQGYQLRLGAHLGMVLRRSHGLQGHNHHAQQHEALC
ncbi:Fibrinogen-like protein A [Lonchura striata]|uniref:Fibrinogen-like protein A n=1 Tax=Lonchura striata TaxID=40157 RepID=A0A218UFH0_9PASE|nr:Fibrinogen-like protein A [Lonchura striata domestica]